MCEVQENSIQADEKSKFAVEEMQMLGFVVGNGKRKLQGSKIQGLLDWPDPQSVADVISFRAYANFISWAHMRTAGQEQILILLTIIRYRCFYSMYKSLDGGYASIMGSSGKVLQMSLDDCIGTASRAGEVDI